MSEQEKIPKNEILQQLIQHQLPNIEDSQRLKSNDLKRICKYINHTIFDEEHCCIWDGYVTNINNDAKGTYINFYFRGKKVALHRLLYINFVESLNDDEYIKFSCPNKGACCCIYHLKKFSYLKKNTRNNVVRNKKTGCNVVQKKEYEGDGLNVDFGW